METKFHKTRTNTNKSTNKRKQMVEHNHLLSHNGRHTSHNQMGLTNFDKPNKN